MTLLSIPYLPLNTQNTEKLPLHKIENEPWKTGRELSCAVAFSVSHHDEGVQLRFAVTEPHLRARKHKINGDVHKDNCVEFFIAFGDDANYYNFEFNCLGSVKGAYGKNRYHRKFIPIGLMRTVADNLFIDIDNRLSGGGIRWEIIVNLPLSVFSYSKLQSLSDLDCAVNFAKCGDALPAPHFISWVKLSGEKPDFHQPGSFAKASFEAKRVEADQLL
ncbi:hypothetical protein D0C36_18785 [Mucilaginibacter conchicola]|uniref:Carbohydrate-binding domain-containing protein n=1 Tax=Mucilaginibacter conchicola TaxID=2303333 RepID=A0A372NPY9_9SPHI|nr:carbohydrate-binding family 9-like protein [Mucilaginibacter conchicola]RFZ90992.1 hypothetical protein D0C36_18785 [Mucilaginibacter conchicola]